jgi:hypothetical protein
MMNLAHDVYFIREIQKIGAGSAQSSQSQSALSEQRAATIITRVRDPTYTADMLATEFPVESVLYGANLMSISHGDESMSDIQITRVKALVRAMKEGQSLDSLVDTFPDIVALGAYDLIQLDKWIKTKTFPS